MKRKVLILSYYFPPAGGPGVQRILKFTKYLEQFNYEPIVITVKNGEFPALDDSMLKEIPDSIKIYRIPAWEPYKIYKKFTGKKIEDKILVGILSGADDVVGSESFAHWIRRNLFIPDARIGWILPVLRKIGDIIEKHKPDLIFSSSPPHSLQLTAKYIAKKYNLSWVADFRDPWTDIYYYQNDKRLKLAVALDKYFEKSVINRANRVITVSPSLVRNFRKKSKKDNVRLIYNGYESADILTQTSVEKYPDRFVISYIGNYKVNQNVPVFLEVLKEMLEEDKAFAKSFRLNFVGVLNEKSKSLISDYGLGSNLDIEGYVPHKIAVERMRASSSLLFIIPQSKDNKGILTGKIFEYLASGVPILPIGPPDGDAADIILNCKAGKMINYYDKNGLKIRLRQLYVGWKTNTLHQYVANLEMVEKKYERISLTAQLAEVFNELKNDK